MIKRRAWLVWPGFITPPPADGTPMIKATYHDFRLLRWAICPVCPTQTRDITSSGWARTGSGGGRDGFGFGMPCPSDQIT
jgi:hypothetical protein